MVSVRLCILDLEEPCYEDALYYIVEFTPQAFLADDLDLFFA